MNSLSIILFWALLSLLLIQIPFLATFISTIRKHLSVVKKTTQKLNISDKTLLPSATVVLCLRGEDPFLRNCLQGLLSQDYPNYQVHIIVDSKEDPAWEIVARTLSQSTTSHFDRHHVKVNPLEVKYQTCILKCSALIQAISDLDDDCEVVAFIDADTVPHSTWLYELVAPLEDRSIGITVGNRWYIPIEQGWGSVVRYLWNVAAVVQMNFYTIPWAGCLALRKDRFQQTKLLERWQYALCDDVLLCSVMQEYGLGIKFIPSLIMVNREDCKLSSFIRWMSRQLLFVRLYHPSWWLIISHGLINSLILSVAIATLLLASIENEGTSAIRIANGLIIYSTVLVLYSGILEREVRQVIALRGEALPNLTTKRLAKTFLAILLTQYAFTIAIISAMQLQMIEWRGICYKVLSPWNVRLLQYRPYDTTGNSANTKISI
jgi:cellulose synthase/poly-beta-1,6-N-acetylglucosamine synthase-like glycosyltransferase